MDNIIWNTAGVVLIITGSYVTYLAWKTKDDIRKQRIIPDGPEWPDPKGCSRVGGHCHCQQIEECIYNDL